MIYIGLFIVGLLFGSFGSVILPRLGTDLSRKKTKSVLRWRSECPHCHHTLIRKDLFPVLSWLFTGGKCRYCHTKISFRYLLLEIGNGLLFAAIGYRRMLYGGGDITLLFILLLAHWCLHLLLVYDIRTMYLHPVMRRLLVAACAVLIFYGNSIAEVLAAAQRLFVFLIGFLLFYRLAKLYVRRRFKENSEGIGQGDVMLAPLVGVIIRKSVSLMTPTMSFSRFTIIQSFRYYIIIACVSAFLLLICIPVIREWGKRIVPFFPGMIMAVRIVLIIWKWLTSFIMS